MRHDKHIPPVRQVRRARALRRAAGRASRPFPRGLGRRGTPASRAQTAPRQLQRDGGVGARAAVPRALASRGARVLVPIARAVRERTPCSRRATTTATRLGSGCRMRRSPARRSRARSAIRSPRASASALTLRHSAPLSVPHQSVAQSATLAPRSAHTGEAIPAGFALLRCATVHPHVPVKAAALHE